MDNKLVVLQIYSSRAEAEVSRGLLESNGIVCMIQSDDAGGMYPAPTALSPGVQLLVRKEDLEQAQKLLNSIS